MCLARTILADDAWTSPARTSNDGVERGDARGCL
jgi:hypothetical protein